MVSRLTKKQIVRAVDKRFMMEIYDETFGVDNKTVLEIFNHLFTKHGKIKNDVIKENRKTFERPPDFSEPIDVYFYKQQKCQTLADDAKEPISEAEMVRVLADHVGATGMANEKYTAWKRITNLAQKTWVIAKDYFRDALEDAEDIIGITAAESGLSANSATLSGGGTEGIHDQVQDEIVNQLEGHFDRLAMAATERRSGMESLTASVERLSKQIETLTKTNEKLANQLAAANSRIQRLEGSRNSNNNRCNNNNSDDHRPGSRMGLANIPCTRNKRVYWPKKNQPWPAETDPNAYCWTCGYLLAPGHNSATCPKAANHPSHKKEATRRNTMGGSAANKGWGNSPNGL